jgi:uncharacterized protein
MLEIECAGERLQLLQEKGVFWPRLKTLIIADLHLGKPAAFRSAGIAVPESTTGNDLSRLGEMVRETNAARLIILGDLFHAKTGLQRGMLDTVTLWRTQISHLEIILLPGNHDRKSGPPPAEWNIQEVDSPWLMAPFSFSHEPDILGEGYRLCGHIHPAIFLREPFGGSLRAPCFCFGPKRAILPAFGSFTGMSNLSPQPGDRIFAIGAHKNELVELAPSKTRRT